MRIAAAVLACLVLVLPAAAQQRAGETIEVSIVNVDVHVTDKKGNRVTGLTANDFEIRENGRVQPITNFAEYAPAPAGATSIEPGAQAAATPAPKVRRTIVFFIESETLATFRAKELFDSMRALVRKTVRPGDRAAITTWTRILRVRMPPTDDVPALVAALDTIEKESVGVHGNPGEDVREAQAEMDAFEQQYEDVLAEAGLSARTGGGMMEPRSMAKHQFFQIKRKAAAIESLMQGISGADGQKIVVMATNRFGRYAGAEFFSGGTVPTENQGELDTSRFREALIRTANAHGITIYAMFPEGLAWTPKAEASTNFRPGVEQDLTRNFLDSNILLNETYGLGEIAADTGGLMERGTRNIAAILPRIADDLDAYYSLGYRARGSGEDKTRKISVTAKNAAYVVRARRQFVEKSDTTRMRDRVVASLFQNLGGATIPLDMSLGAFKPDGRNRWTAPLTIRIPIGKLTTLRQANGEAGAFSIFVVTGAVFGTMSDVEQRTQQFTIPIADLDRARASHFKYEFTLKLDKVADRVAVGVLDETSREFGLAVAMIRPR